MKIETKNIHALKEILSEMIDSRNNIQTLETFQNQYKHLFTNTSKTFQSLTISAKGFISYI